MPHIDVNGNRLHYLRRGDGEPLLMIQGLSGTHMHWGEEFLALLVPDFDVITYDHRGVGQSSPTDVPFTIAELADDAIAVLDEVAVERAHVLGISMGGMIAQQLALRHSERLRTLALGCTYAGGRDSALTDPAVIQQLSKLFMSGQVEEALRAGFEYNVSADFARDPANFELVKEIAARLPARLDVMLLQLQAIAAHDTSERLHEIAMPTLVVHGTDDQMLPVSNAYAIASRIPGARLEILEGVGHAFWWERPQRSAELLRELASDVAEQRSGLQAD